MRGEHCSLFVTFDGHLGSSPHARGALIVGNAERHAGGIIPACAGSTEEQLPTELMEQGSSPHARGAPVLIVVDVDAFGIIPACAGSTPRHREEVRRAGDHPRMRGEHALPLGSSLTPRGSSPHARGAPAACCLYSGDVGIIPACAGSTATRTALRLLKGDHPRMRGEHSMSHSASSLVLGSSPHARGAPIR